jgi:hypothetical protein
LILPDNSSHITWEAIIMPGTLSNLVALATDHAGVLIPLAILLPALLLFFGTGKARNDEPPPLKERIPWFSNTYQYMTDLQAFTERAR